MKARWFGLAALACLFAMWLWLRREPSVLAPEPAMGPRPASPAPVAAPLEIAVEDDAAPWAQADGTGYANDLVRAAFAAAGEAVELSVVPYARCKQMVIDGSVVGCFAMSKEPGLESSVAFPSEPLFVCQCEFVQRVGDARRVTSAADVARGTVLGVVIGYEYPPLVAAWLREGRVQLDESRSEELLLRKLAESRIDAALVNDNDTKPLAYTAARAGVSGKVASSFQLGELRSFIGFSRRHAEGGRALDAFSKGLSSIAENGQRSAIDARWARRAQGAP